LKTPITKVWYFRSNKISFIRIDKNHFSCKNKKLSQVKPADFSARAWAEPSQAWLHHYWLYSILELAIQYSGIGYSAIGYSRIGKSGIYYSGMDHSGIGYSGIGYILKLAIPEFWLPLPLPLQQSRWWGYVWQMTFKN
jgi:hypothetical protein